MEQYRGIVAELNMIDYFELLLKEALVGEEDDDE
jgi:hypothetical protein